MGALTNGRTLHLASSVRTPSVDFPCLANAAHRGCGEAAAVSEAGCRRLFTFSFRRRSGSSCSRPPFCVCGKPYTMSGPAASSPAKSSRVGSCRVRSSRFASRQVLLWNRSIHRVASCRVLSSPVESSRVGSRLVRSSQVKSLLLEQTCTPCRVPSRHVAPCRVLSGRVTSSQVPFPLEQTHTPCQVRSGHVLSCPVLSSHVLSYPVLSSQVFFLSANGESV